MEALFFISDRSSAVGVRSQDDLPTDPLGEGLPVQGLRSLRPLVSVLAQNADDALRQLRDATCQSFPIWSFSPTLVGALRALDATQLESVGQAWLDACGDAPPDADLHEICLLLEAIQSGLREADDVGEELFVLLEERAF